MAFPNQENQLPHPSNCNYLPRCVLSGDSFKLLLIINFVSFLTSSHMDPLYSLYIPAHALFILWGGPELET
jgi:hypothetical protein